MSIVNYFKSRIREFIILAAMLVSAYFWKSKSTAVEVAYMEGLQTATDDIHRIIKEECPKLDPSGAKKLEEPTINLPQISPQN